VNAWGLLFPFFGVDGSACTAVLAPGASCSVGVVFTPVSEGPVTGTLTLQNSPGTQTVALSGTGEKSLTTHYYRSILRRAPDPSGTVFWANEAARLAALGVNTNETWFAMAQAFFTSPEYVAFNRDDAAYLTDLYTTFFNRAPDPSGIAFWTSQLQQRMPREVVLASFELSPEFVSFAQAIFGNTAARAEVDTVMDFYRGLLSRLPDDAGLQHWVSRFRNAQCTGSGLAARAVADEIESISSTFTTGLEYQNRNRTNGQYVGDLYNAFYRRGGDLAGVQNWIAQLGNGTYTRERERQLFIITPEFQARVARIVAQGCMP
jgi:hypothetical protein